MISLTAALKAPFNNSNSLRACAVLLRKADMQLKDTQLFRQQAFIDGAWVDADNGQTIKVNNPATGEILGTVPKMGAAETRRAIEAADKALPAWRALTAKDRANKLRRWFELIIENQDDLARLMTLEQGKPLAEAKGEIVYAASFIEWFAEEAKRVYGDVIPGHQPDKRLIYRNNGQTCVCANRLYIQDSVYDAFAEKLKVAVAKLKIGNGLEEGTTTGPLIDEKAVAKVQEHIADALSKGATLLAGGKVMEGNFFEPTILVNVPKDAAVAKEETFGPLAPLFRFKDEAEVIAMSNDTEFGLASYFYARDLGRVFRVAEALEYGMVGVNTGLISNEVAPFGGIKASGLGREGSKYGIEDYLEIKYLCLGI
eukprot:gene8235-9683_t